MAKSSRPTNITIIGGDCQASSATFQVTTEHLIGAAEAADNELDNIDDELPQLSEVLASGPWRESSSTANQPPSQTTSNAGLTARNSTLVYCRIKLRDVFNYDVDGGEHGGLRFYWDMGRLGAEREAQVLELAQGDGS
jgi:hypothetical protein